jgi:uncharacterized membrane protein (DUF2068 family)
MGRPTGVTVIAVLDFIGAGFCVLAGLGMMLGGGVIATMMSQQSGAAGAGLLGVIGAAAGVFLLACAAIAALLGWGLLKLKEWARIVTIIFAALGALGAVFSVFALLAHFVVFGIFWALVRLAINGLIIWYLLQPQVKAAFQGVQARAAGA